MSLFFDSVLNSSPAERVSRRFSVCSLAKYDLSLESCVTAWKLFPCSIQEPGQLQSAEEAEQEASNATRDAFT